jgi:SAM-dependent methyltransferase
MSRRADPYDTFARVYDAWQAGFSKPFSEAIFPFYEREILARRAPERSLADLACGTGTFLAAWHRRHPDWLLTGTDQSTAMLSVARRRLRAGGRNVSLFSQPLQRTALPAPVGAIVCVFDSVNHLLKPTDLRRTFRAAHRSLLPGGLFLFDVTDDREFPGFFQGTWAVETEDLHVTATAEYSPDRRSGLIHFTVFDRKGSVWRRSDFDVRERSWTAADLRSALEAAGFTVLRARRVQPYPPEEADPPRPLWIARR